MENQIEQVKSATDILQIVGSRVNLTRAGKNFKGLCPFHSEKSPSFFVTPDLQRYKCFGCGKSGDVFTFLQELDGLTFAESLQLLAERAGITLEQKVFSHEDQQRKKLYDMLDLTAEYFHYLLREHRLGEHGRAYFKQRGISNETIKTFRLGYALNSWDALSTYLIKKKKFSQKEIMDAGLIVPGRGGNTYDRFRGRVIFPLTDHQGRVVGFSGRVLDPTAKEAKYINSPETVVYHKSELLFGFSTLRQMIRKEEEAIVVEGELDVLSSYQASVQNIVAIKGSALTEQHVRLLSRTVKRIVLALDADSAGVEATKRAIEIAKPFEMSLRVLPLIGGKDPDDIAREHPKTWREMSKKTISVFEFLIEAAFRDKDLTTGEGKRLATQAVVPILQSISNAVEQAHHIQQVADRLKVKTEVLETELRKFRGQRQLRAPATKEKPEKKKQENALSRVERYLFALLLQGEIELVHSAAETLPAAQIQDHALQKLYEALYKYAKTHKTLVLADFSRAVPEELQLALSEAYLESDYLRSLEDKEQVQKEWDKALAVYQREYRTFRLEKLSEEMKILEDKLIQTPDDEKLTRSLEELQNELTKLSVS